jgi:hypothetical protein
MENARGVGELRGGADVQAGDQQGYQADAQRHALARAGVAESVPDDQRAAAGQVQVLDHQRAEAAVRAERLDERVDDDQQRDHSLI